MRTFCLFVINDLLQNWNAILSIVALLVSIIALFYTVMTYILKAGHSLRCNYTISSDRQADEKFVSSITLENLKDRATVIFDIYLKIGRNIYLRLEEFDEQPLILKPFEVYQKNYDAVTFYAAGMNCIKMKELISLENSQIIVATTAGKKKVKTNYKRWDANVPFFRNYFTAIVNPIRLVYNGKGYGSRVKYLVHLKYTKGKDEVVPIMNGDDQIRIFNKFMLTSESLLSMDNLKEFLNLQIKNGNLTCESYEIIDYYKEMLHSRNRYNSHELKGEILNFFEYNIKGRIITFFEKRRMNLGNRRLAEQKGKKVSK